MWKILIVDDNSENRQLLVEILRDVAECDAVGNAKDAFEAYKKSLGAKPHQLILLDIEMPEVDGLEILRTIRQDEKSRGIPLGDGVPIIMVTAHKKPFLNAFYQGCTDYILKPIDAQKLIDKIQQRIEKAGRY